ncbi:hypothetical protein CHS0354_033364 [Potamilus streckersoni]|uniref:Coiled-coil domain-containing protein 13 n=1 Tax=Potamilus streckersoni TaxID=2493646 RepID=A0AAE0VJR3_9BIVA|nr:hypothetical protein CHS0354_033364 [Potamilus streckersoni]
MESTDESLKKQFQLLQEQQQKKLLRRKQRKEEREKSAMSAVSASSNAFGIDDNLNLKLSEPPKINNSYLSEELVDHLNNQIRELKDENGRAYRLLSERDFEIRNLKKKWEEEKAAMAAAGGPVTNETAGLKIVELSKKVRDLTAELESEKTKSKQLSKKCHDFQQQLSNITTETRSMTGSSTSLRSIQVEEKPEGEIDVKGLQEKLKQTESKLLDFKNQCSTLKQELNKAQKALQAEVGDNVNVQTCLNGTSNWRGRAQQILALHKRVEELKSQLESQNVSGEGDIYDLTGDSTSARRKTAVDRQREQQRKIEKERKEAQEKQAAEMKTLEEENNSLKQKLDASKTRNKVLSNEVKANKQQLQTLLQKGQHDDELIEALMKQQTQLRQMLDDATRAQHEVISKNQEKLTEMAAKTQHDNNIVEQLKKIVQEKEGKVKHLEQEIHQLKLNHLQKTQMEGVDSLFYPRPIRQQPSGIPVRQQSTLSSRPSTAGNDIVELEFTVDSATPTPQSRLSERPPSGKSTSVGESQGAGDLSWAPPSRKSNSRPPSGLNNVDRQLLVDLQHQCQEHVTSAKVAEVEREKLMELVQVLQSRLDEANKKYNDCQNELIQQRRKNVQLEKQSGKAKLDGKGGGTSARKKSTAKSSLSASVTAMPTSNEEEQPTTITNVEELQINLEIQRDENEALKAALQSTLKAKEEDLKMYNTMIEETKKVFLQALRQYKQNVAGT